MINNDNDNDNKTIFLLIFIQSLVICCYRAEHWTAHWAFEPKTYEIWTITTLPNKQNDR